MNSFTAPTSRSTGSRRAILSGVALRRWFIVIGLALAALLSEAVVLVQQDFAPPTPSKWVTEASVSALNAPLQVKAGWVEVSARVVIIGRGPASIDCSIESVPGTLIVGASEVGGAGSMSFGSGPYLLRSPASARLTCKAVPSGTFGGVQLTVRTPADWQGAPWYREGLGSAHPFGKP